MGCVGWLDEFATRRRILWLGWLLFVIYCYPGYMSTDSVDQLLQARGINPMQDGHPPVMALLWRLTDSIVAGPFPMLVIQSVAFLLGLDAILRRVVQPRTAAIVASAMLVFPPLMTPMAVIWKDSQMAGFLLAGTACLLSDRRWIKVAGCALLWLATAQRYNAVAATLPLVGGLFVWRGVIAGWRRYAIACAVWLAISAAAFAANAALAEQKMHAWHRSVALMDIVGVVTFAPELDDDEVRAALAGVTIVPRANLQRELRGAYNPHAWLWLVQGEGHVLEAPGTEAERDAVEHAWRTLVVTYPGAYVRHRGEVFATLLGLGHKRPDPEWAGFTDGPDQEQRIGQRAMHSAWQARWLRVIPATKWLVIYRPWLYAVVGLVLLVLCRRDRLPALIVTSGLVYELGLFFAAPSTDYRYSHWMMVCTTLAYAIAFARRWQRGRGARKPPADVASPTLA
ncbi:MAG TPA: hypothetical protein VFQ53_38000 [Kofleriaceae bacterium]|nr:hypothetical protein [Kofleriaceae bacterium]